MVQYVGNHADQFTGDGDNLQADQLVVVELLRVGSRDIVGVDHQNDPAQRLCGLAVVAVSKLDQQAAGMPAHR